MGPPSDPGLVYAVAELVRTVRPGGVVAIEPGGSRACGARSWIVRSPRSAPMPSRSGCPATGSSGRSTRRSWLLEPSRSAWSTPRATSAARSKFFDEASAARTLDVAGERRGSQARDRRRAGMGGRALRRLGAPLDPEAPMRWHRYRVSGPVFGVVDDPGRVVADVHRRQLGRHRSIGGLLLGHEILLPIDTVAVASVDEVHARVGANLLGLLATVPLVDRVAVVLLDQGRRARRPRRSPPCR